MRKYDCCINSCLSYAMYPEASECLHCGHPRWKVDKNYRHPGNRPEETPNSELPKKPYAQHTYMPLSHRMRLWWSNRSRVETMIRYRNVAVLDRAEGLVSDFWTGTLYSDLRTRRPDGQHEHELPMFHQDTDIGFFLSTDGVKVFKSRRAFYIWPLLLVGYPI